jgi:hypothetical protein
MDLLLFTLIIMSFGMAFIGVVLSGIIIKQKTIIAKQDALMAKLIEIKLR